MKPDEMQRWLTAEEYGVYQDALADILNPDKYVAEALESLARRTELLERALAFVECVYRERGREYLENSADLQEIIAAELDGLPRGDENGK